MIDIKDEDAELIRLRVAEKLGWRAVEYSRDSVLVGLRPGKRLFGAVPSYARDLKAAWEIVEFLIRLHVRITIANEPLRGYGRDYIVEIGENNAIVGKAHHNSAPWAICLAFLEAPALRKPGFKNPSFSFPEKKL